MLILFSLEGKAQVVVRFLNRLLVFVGEAQSGQSGAIFKDCKKLSGSQIGMIKADGVQYVKCCHDECGDKKNAQRGAVNMSQVLEAQGSRNGIRSYLYGSEQGGTLRKARWLSAFKVCMVCACNALSKTLSPYRASCCGLCSAERVLETAGLSLPPAAEAAISFRKRSQRSSLYNI